VSLGAAYLGVIFAGGPREVSQAIAAEVLAAARGSVKRVGVFATGDAEVIARTADAVGLDVVQLHSDLGPETIAAVRTRTGREIWAVVRIHGTDVPGETHDLARAADALLVDARVEGKPGGTGVVLPWSRLSSPLKVARAGKRLVLAGGLTPENVGEAIATLEPDVVDVSSGVEIRPGVKDHQRMRAFAKSVLG
jgi:phosphoribosylanthranilate isomerase